MNDNLRYELTAEAFYRMTGMMAPGKDPGMVVVDDAARNAAWRVWREAYKDCVAAMCDAVDEIMGDGR